MKKKHFTSKRIRGQGLAEATAGMVLIVIMSLVTIDLLTVAAGASVNDELAKRAARSAAGQPNLDRANIAVATVRSNFPTAGVVQAIDELTVAEFNPGHGGEVRVHSRLSLNLPVPVPFYPQFSTLSIQTEAHEPIVSLEAQADPLLQTAASVPGS